MAPILMLDTLEDLEATEDCGVIVSLTRKCMIYNLTSTDFSVLYEAGAVAGMPQVNSYPIGYPGLRLRTRKIELIPNDPTKCYLYLGYVSYGQEDLSFIMQGETSLGQVESNNDPYGNQIVVQHTWPGSDPDYAGLTQYQGGVVKAMVPQATISGRGVIYVDYPLNIALAWEGAVNASYWANGFPGTWMCSRVSFVPLNLGTIPRQWTFTFEFQYNKLGWQPSAIFIDRRTGRPPVNLVANLGYKTVNWYSSLEFKTLFPDT